MLTKQQYKWLTNVKDGRCDMSHRNKHPRVFIYLSNNGFITYHSGKYHITEKGLLELQESRRSWSADDKSTIALWLSAIAIVVTILGLIL